MSTSTRPSSSAAKPTDYQKTAADIAMLVGGVAKPTAQAYKTITPCNSHVSALNMARLDNEDTGVAKGVPCYPIRYFYVAGPN
jgi:hypothetical protein